MTEMERQMLTAIVRNDYQDDMAHPVGHQVWTWSACEGFGTSAGGVMASLTKKGWATVEEGENADDDRCAITEAGWAALRSSS